MRTLESTLQETREANQLRNTVEVLSERVQAVEHRPPDRPLTGAAEPFSPLMLNELIDNIDEAVICTDLSGDIVLCNRQASVLGLVAMPSKGEQMASQFEEEVNGPRDDFATWDSLIERVTVKTDSGRRLAMTKKTAPIQDENGRTVAFANIYRDMTQATLLREEQLRSSKLETLEMIAGGVAHDINNMLTSILANLSLLEPKRTGADREPVVWHPSGSTPVPMSDAPDEIKDKRHPEQDLLDDVRTAALQCAALTKQLLGFSKQQHNTLEVCSMEELVRDTVGFTMRGSPCTWVMEVDENIPMVEVNKVQISRVIQNLLINACESMTSGGQVAVRLGSAETPDFSAPRQIPSVRLSIQDRGCGMEASHLARVFDPHFSSKPDGNGLGLAVSYAIIKHHDGQLTAESVVDEGTIFHVDLPASTHTLTPQVPISADEAELQRLTGRILLVESDTQVLESIGRLLTRIGLEVSYARDGHQALALFEDAQARGSSYCATILDLALQGDLSADQTLDRLKSVDPDVLAVASSNHAMGGAQSQMAGFCATLSKPYDISDLGSTLGAVLDKRP
jgi:signal transduction histidine kinase/ActR/RegA family two-component response regulator